MTLVASRDWIPSRLLLACSSSVSLSISWNVGLISLTLVKIEMKQYVSPAESLLAIEIPAQSSYSLPTGLCYEQLVTHGQLHHEY